MFILYMGPESRARRKRLRAAAYCVRGSFERHFMFTRRIPLPDMIDLCRSLRHQLSAGVSIQRVLTQQSERGRSSIRGVARRLSDSIRGGESLAGAIEREQYAFPPVFLAMMKVGESTGHIAEIFGELEKYFELELQLRRQFR